MRATMFLMRSFDETCEPDLLLMPEYSEFCSVSGGGSSSASLGNPVWSCSSPAKFSSDSASKSIPSCHITSSRRGRNNRFETVIAVKPDSAAGSKSAYVSTPIISKTSATGVSGKRKQAAKRPVMPKTKQGCTTSSAKSSSMRAGTIWRRRPQPPPKKAPLIRTGSRMSPGPRTDRETAMANSFPAANMKYLPPERSCAKASCKDS
mmetsp:Transcript_7753/g.12616  ORF Transcript_7753/g.12616 Transcript_7753/m.12616 type:complete len:206 (-) Transcript_7753:562-1179(-)